MDFKLERIEDKIEFFEANDLHTLEKQINTKVEQNQAILLEVKSVTHQSQLDFQSGQKYFTAVVHFKAKNSF